MFFETTSDCGAWRVKVGLPSGDDLDTAAFFKYTMPSYS